MSAPNTYVTITPGPASRIVTVLPRNRPTQIAPPIAIIAIWRGTSLRLSPSSVGRGAGSAERVMTRPEHDEAALNRRARNEGSCRGAYPSRRPIVPDLYCRHVLRDAAPDYG